MFTFYKSATHGPIPLSQKGKDLLQKLRGAISDAILARDFCANYASLSHARGDIAVYLSTLENKAATPRMPDEFAKYPTPWRIVAFRPPWMRPEVRNPQYGVRAANNSHIATFKMLEDAEAFIRMRAGESRADQCCNIHVEHEWVGRADPYRFKDMHLSFTRVVDTPPWNFPPPYGAAAAAEAQKPRKAVCGDIYNAIFSGYVTGLDYVFMSSIGHTPSRMAWVQSAYGQRWT